MLPSDPQTPQLRADLEAALLRELLAAWHDLNHSHFGQALRPPALLLSEATGYLGRWVRQERCIELSRRLVLEHPWGVVCEVLKHEMAHQYVHEVLHVLDESAHGPAFRAVCQRLGIDASAGGLPRAPGGAEEERVLQRVARLLALAESSNLHEAEAAMREAQRLMLKYNIETAGTGAQAGYGFRHIGPVRSRVSESERLIGMILGNHFFVEVIWVRSFVVQQGRSGWVLEVCGSPANLEMAEYVYNFLVRTAEQLWQEHKRAHGLRSDRDRRTFIAGVMLGFDEKLNKQKNLHRSQGLVWQGDGDLARYLRQRHPRIRLTRSQGHVRNEAHEHGRAAGRSIVLHRPISAAARCRGLVLPPRR
ncbi:MAG: DUF2786 domain-containing protein [Myxococcales bacterium]|nr:SprT-like domain-containing protein [Myxococcota bacterium]MDW8280578.1 DUF2786 domain-containing protein [Myxococcales bacterium]